MNPKPDAQRFVERQLAAQEKYGLPTNDILKIAGRQPPRVNGRALKVSAHALTVLYLLAVRAMETPGDYFSTEDLVLAIEKRGRVLGELRMSWDRPTPEQVHSAISDLRKALRKRRLNVTLVDSVREKGYRLATPAMNIVTDLSGAEILIRLAADAVPARPAGDSRDRLSGYS